MMIPINKVTFYSWLFIHFFKSLNPNIGYIRLRTPLCQKNKTNEVGQCVYMK